MRKAELLFVYNAKSGLMHQSFDYLYKMLSPQTYTCHLCALTHGTFKEHKAWSDFRKKLGIDFDFLYADKFEKEFPLHTTDYPVVYLKSNVGPKKLISASEINAIHNLAALIELIKAKLQVESIQI